jgi:HPt (histidine-containing phosphotransfer) domain-containing protein
MNNIFDESVIKSLRDIEKQSNQDIVSEMISEFSESLEKNLKSMQSFLNSSNYLDLAKLAHSLKSSSGNLGAIGISNICEKIESMISHEKNYDPERLRSYLNEFESISKQTLEHLKQS